MNSLRRYIFSIFLLLVSGCSFENAQLDQEVDFADAESEAMAYEFDEPRIALVIGNANYERSGWELRNPENDAKAMASTLTNLGFEVTLKVNASKKDMEDSFRAFSNDIRAFGTDGISLFYYSGHAVQNNSTNYLLPVDLETVYQEDVEYNSPPISGIFRAMADADNSVNIIILDSCRDNPMQSRFKLKSVPTRGLSDFYRTPDTLIAFSTSVDNVAADGIGNLSPYTGALIDQLRQKPEQSVVSLFEKVGATVFKRTNGKQSPEYRDSLVRAPGWSFIPAGRSDALRSEDKQITSLEDAVEHKPLETEFAKFISSIKVLRENDDLDSMIKLSENYFKSKSKFSKNERQMLSNIFEDACRKGSSSGCYNEIFFIFAHGDYYEIDQNIYNRALKFCIDGIDLMCTGIVNAYGVGGLSRDNLNSVLGRLDDIREAGKLDHETLKFIRWRHDFALANIDDEYIAFLQEFGLDADPHRFQNMYVELSQAYTKDGFNKVSKQAAKSFNYDPYDISDLPDLYKNLVGKLDRLLNDENQDGSIAKYNDLSGSYHGQVVTGERSGLGRRVLEHTKSRTHNILLNRYDGEFLNGKWHGKGVVWSIDGRSLIAGVWSNDELVKAEYVR